MNYELRIKKPINRNNKIDVMKYLLCFLITLSTVFSFSQEKDKAAVIAARKANNYVYEANNLLEDDFVSAEKEYRKAISQQSTTVAGIYNLGNSYIKKGNLDEAIYRLDQAAKIANSKSEKHKAYHNIGNVLMKNKKCKEAVEAYKSALRNNPTDNETRYNLALAKSCAEQQKDDNKDDKDKDKKDDKKNDKKDQDKKEGDDKKDQDKKDGDDKKDDRGKPKEDKNDKGKGDGKQPPPQPRPGQMSPQQVKSLLEAMNNQEQKVQEKINAEKQKGVKVKTEKDW